MDTKEITETETIERKKSDVWKKQQRDSLGHWRSFDGTRNRKFTLKDIKTAYMAGMQDSSGILLPSKRLELFLRKNGFLD